MTAVTGGGVRGGVLHHLGLILSAQIIVLCLVVSRCVAVVGDVRFDVASIDASLQQFVPHFICPGYKVVTLKRIWCFSVDRVN